MDFIATGLIISCSTLGALLLLFRYERRKGVRVGEKVRQYIDFGAYIVHENFERISWFVGRDCVRQVFHYLFHTVLRVILSFLRRCEYALKNAMRVNKTLAKNVERENMERSKLEEIAIHKVENALSEEEKKVHKDKALKG